MTDTMHVCIARSFCSGIQNVVNS